MEILNRFLQAFQFLTKITIKKDLLFDETRLEMGLRLAPLTGLAIGLIMAGIAFGLRWFFPGFFVAVIIILIYVYVAGGLHLDGLGDFFDALASNSDKDKFIRVMKDSRLGTGGFLAVFFVLILDITLLAYIDENILIPVLLLFPVSGRLALIIAGAASVYPEGMEGSARGFMETTGFKNIVPGVLIGFIAFLAAFSYWGALLFAGSAIVSLVLAKIWSRKLGGLTGDILGALVESTQVAYLVFCYIIFNIWKV